MLQAIMYNYVNQNVKFMKKLNILSMLRVLKPNLFYLINLFGTKNVILQGKVEDKILNEARQRHVTEKLRNFWTWNCGTLQRVFCLNNVAYRAMAHFYG